MSRKLRWLAVGLGVTTLVWFLGMSFEAVRTWRVTVALDKLRPTDTHEVPQLIERLHDYNLLIRVTAIHALTRMGASAKDANPALIETLKDPSSVVRSNAAEALAAIGDDAAIPCLIAGLDDPELVVRRYCAAAIGKYSARAEAAVPKLIERLDDPEMTDVVLAVLGKIGPPAKAAIPKLIVALEMTHGVTQFRVMLALEQFGTDAAPALPLLQKLTQDPELGISQNAVLAIQNITEPGSVITTTMPNGSIRREYRKK